MKWRFFIAMNGIATPTTDKNEKRKKILFDQIIKVVEFALYNDIYDTHTYTTWYI